MLPIWPQEIFPSRYFAHAKIDVVLSTQKPHSSHIIQRGRSNILAHFKSLGSREGELSRLNSTLSSSSSSQRTPSWLEADESSVVLVSSEEMEFVDGVVETRLGGLDQDSMREILANLDARSLAHCAQTCTRMQSFCADNLLWQSLFRVRFIFALVQTVHINGDTLLTSNRKIFSSIRH